MNPIAIYPSESKVKFAQSCLTLCYPMDSNLPGSSIHKDSPDKILESVTIRFTRGSSQCRYQTQVSLIAGEVLTISATRKLPLKILLPVFHMTQERQSIIIQFPVVLLSIYCLSASNPVFIACSINTSPWAL